MNSIDLAAILANVAGNLFSVRRLLTGLAFLLGLLFFFIALKRLKNMAGTYRSHEKIFIPFIYILIGSLLLYLPSAITALGSSLFGSGNLFAYSDFNSRSIYNSMYIIIQTIGILWFVRGCSLVVHSDQPGSKDGRKGLLFIISGILCIHFENTIAMLGSLLLGFIHWVHG
jgi:uncharacterized membrane protein